MGSRILTFICLSVGLSVGQSVRLFNLQGKSDKFIWRKKMCIQQMDVSVPYVTWKRGVNYGKSTNEWVFSEYQR